MISKARRLLWVLLRAVGSAVVGVVTLTVIADAATPQLPSGSSDGRIAVRVVPDEPVDDTNAVFRECEVHLVRTDDQSRELVYGCGSWFQPPVGRYLFWLEQGSRVSFQSVIKYVGEPSDESGLTLSKAMFPAVFVRLSSKTPISDDDTFRVVSLERIANYRAFDRRIDYAHARRPVTMPVGNVIAGIFDRTGRALSISKPQAVATARTTTVHPRRPGRRRADVLAVLERHPSEGARSACTAALTTPKGKDIRPGVAMETDDRLVLAWYGIAAPSVVRLSVQCGGQSLVRTVHVRRRAIETVRAFLPRS